MENIIQWINIVFLALNATIVYFNLIHSRKKDFEDQLYKLKLDAYRQLNDESYALLKALDINLTPIVKIYDYETKDEWEKYWLTEVTKLHHNGFALQDLINKHTLYIPDKVVEKVYEFSNHCIGYVTLCNHFNTGLIIDTYSKLWDSYLDSLNEIRKDLGVDLLDKSLKKRISGNIQ